MDFLESYNISVSTILDCDPSYPNQIICLLLAGIFVEVVFITGLTKVITFALKNLMPQRARDHVFQEFSDNWKNALAISDESQHFDTWNSLFQKRGIDKDFRAEFGKLGDKLSWEQKVDAYFEIEENKNVLIPIFLELQAYGMSMQMQHGLVGACGLWAITMTDGKDSFLTFARWGVLFEAGFELFDTLKNFLYPIIFKKQAVDFGKVMLLVHHVTLYFCLPINRSLLPTDYLGRDCVWAMMLYAGWLGPLTFLNFIKSFVDVSTFAGLLTYAGCHLVGTGVFAFGRGVHWPYFAYKLLTYNWGDGWMTWSMVCFLVLLFSFFNVMMLFFIWKGLVKFMKKFKTSYAALKGEKEEPEEEVFVPKRTGRRESSMVDCMIQDLSFSVNSLAGVRSSSKSISLMGIDYELDDDEMKQANIRHSRIMSSRSVFFALNTAFTSLNEDDLPDIKED